MSTQINEKKGHQIINQKIDQRVMSSNEKTTITLDGGLSTTTLQGGLETPIMFKEVLAGEYISNWHIDHLLRILTPMVPSMGKVYATIKAFFVPHTRVWKNAEKKLAGKNEYTNSSLMDNMPSVSIDEQITKNFEYKATLLSKYGIPNKSAAVNINPLLLRGYRAIENDFLRFKEYEPVKSEWDGEGSVSVTESKAINVTIGNATQDSYVLAPAKARSSYLNNIKKNIIDNKDVVADDIMKTSMATMNEHLDWQNAYNDIKQRIDNAEKNDWDIIAEMGGTQPVINDRVQLLGVLDYELNYQQITQSSPDIDGSTPLGTTGSFSFTRANGTLFSHKQFNQHGFIHVLININVDMNVETGINKELLKTSVKDIYRPGLAQKETQLLLDYELDAREETGSYGDMIAYQPAWAEYKRMPSLVTGEMQTTRLNDEKVTGTPAISNSQWHNALVPYGNYISDEILRPAALTNKILARNNILQTLNLDQMQDIFGGNIPIYFMDDPIMSMSKHTVKTSLPIKSSILNQTEKAEEER